MATLTFEDRFTLVMLFHVVRGISTVAFSKRADWPFQAMSQDVLAAITRSIMLVEWVEGRKGSKERASCCINKHWSGWVESAVLPPSCHKRVHEHHIQLCCGYKRLKTWYPQQKEGNHKYDNESTVLSYIIYFFLGVGVLALAYVIFAWIRSCLS